MSVNILIPLSQVTDTEKAVVAADVTDMLYTHPGVTVDVTVTAQGLQVKASEHCALILGDVNDLTQMIHDYSMGIVSDLRML